MNNLKEAIVAYWQANQNVRCANSNLTTALFKYTFPELGFKLSELSKQRIQPEDKELALNYAEQFQLTEQFLKKLLASQEKVLTKVTNSSSNIRQQKKNLTKFIKYINEQYNLNYQKQKKISKYDREPVRIRRKIIDLTHIQEKLTKENAKIARRSRKIALDFNPQKYEGDLEYNKKELGRIQSEIDELCFFLKNNAAGTKKRRKATIEGQIKHLVRLLGWLYINGKSLSEISIYSFIKVFNINPKFEDFNNINDYYIAKGKIELEAKSASKKVTDFLENFYLKYGVTHKGSKMHYAVALLNLAKFLYKDITDDDWFENYGDIPIVRRIRIFINTIPKESKKIKQDLISWDIVIKVLEETRRKADTTHTEFLHWKKDRKTPSWEKRIRPDKRLASDLQAFLAIGFLTLVPPSRKRVVMELKLGETLKHGLFINKLFVSKNKLDNPKEAKYYIHLQPEDYKTGDIYGEWLAEFPNVTFKDGKTFYEYLDKFIYGGVRDYLLNRVNKNNNHNFLLVKFEDGLPCNTSSFDSMTTRRFESIIGQKVSPHKLRTIFRTYLADKNASEAELESAAFWMRHSKKIGEKIYTKQILDKRLAPGIAIAQKLNSELLGAK